MAAFPKSLQLAAGVRARRDATRRAAWLATPARAGDPVLNGAVRRRLDGIGLTVEDDRGPDADTGDLFRINHGPSLIWLRQTRAIRVPSDAAIGTALGRPLAWVAPVYRLPGVKGIDACFVARPDTLLLGASQNDAPAIDAAAARHKLVEADDRSARLKAWRYFRTTGRSSALELAPAIRQRADMAVELEYIPLRSPYAFTPDDTYFSDQWGMRQIGAPAAWDIATGDPAIVVAVIDSGCDLEHADLADGYLNAGVNVNDPTLDGSPIVHAPTGIRLWHGTAVAGVIAARLNNATGVAGVAGGCRVLPIAIATGSTVEVAEAVNVAVSEGAHVINMSNAIGSFWFETSLRPAIDAAVAAGRLVCAAAGNERGTSLALPARYASVMGCGGSDKTDRRWEQPGTIYGSHYGDDIYLGEPVGLSVMAPAVDIVSTDVTGSAGFTPGSSPAADYLLRSSTIDAVFGATSAATPHVAGTAALLMSTYGLTADEARAVIERTAEKTGGYAYADVSGYPNGSRHPEMGYGRLSAARALDFADVMVRDWPDDDGTEPSSPPRGNFYSHSDIVIRPGDDGVFLPDTPDEAGVLVRAMPHTALVRVTSLGPAAARGVRVELRATPWVGLEFVYPEDWTAVDALHLRPTAVDAGPFALAAGLEQIATFRFSAAQVDDMAGWTDMTWHPCLLAVATSANDYAFADAPAGASLQMRRNNIAQRNLTVAPLERRSAEFPFVIGHPSNKDPDLTLGVDIGTLGALGDVHVVLADASRAFPVPRDAKGFGRGTPKMRAVKGGKATRLGKRMAVRVDGPRAFIGLTRPAQARYAMSLAVRLRTDPPAGARWPVQLTQFVRGRAVGGATVIFAA